MSKRSDTENTLIGLSTFEINQRYGSANAEFLKGLRGVDYQTGKIFDRSLIKVSEYKVHAEYVDQNLKQQAGFSAEIAKTSRQNAENIISNDPHRLIRSEDFPGYGKNHDRVDILELLDGKVVLGTDSQVKFVDNYKKLLKNIASPGSGKNDLSRYMEVSKLDLPTEQVILAKEYCREQAQEFFNQAERVKNDGNLELSEKLRKKAEDFEKLESKISDSGLTTQKALEYRLNPELSTFEDIALTSHRAGVEGAKFGAAIGGSISLIINVIALRSGDKDFSDAAISVVTDSGKAAGVGYMTALSGSAIKGFMEQSATDYTRVLSQTCLPSLVVSVCLASSKSIYRYTTGEISEQELFDELGKTASGMVSSSMFATLGQVAIPIPVLGGIIGGMVGYTVSNVFYHGFTKVVQDKHHSEEQLIITQLKCRQAIKVAEEYRIYVGDVFTKKITNLECESQKLFETLKSEDVSIDEFSIHINQFALTLGEKIQFDSMQEFDEFMSSDQDFIL